MAIKRIYANPEQWHVTDLGQKLKDTGEPLLRIVFGCYDDPEEMCDLTILMRKSVYDDAIKRGYTPVLDAQFCSLLLKDGNNTVPRISHLIY